MCPSALIWRCATAACCASSCWSRCRPPSGASTSRSGYRSPRVNDLGNRNNLSCASNEEELRAPSGISPMPTASTAPWPSSCPWLVDYMQRQLLDSHGLVDSRLLPYASLYFFAKLGAFNVGWHEAPSAVSTTRPPRGSLIARRWPTMAARCQRNTRVPAAGAISPPEHWRQRREPTAPALLRLPQPPLPATTPRCLSTHSPATKRRRRPAFTLALPQPTTTDPSAASTGGPDSLPLRIHEKRRGSKPAGTPARSSRQRARRHAVAVPSTHARTVVHRRVAEKQASYAPSLGRQCKARTSTRSAWKHLFSGRRANRSGSAVSSNSPCFKHQKGDMRTTLDISDDVLLAAKRLARRGPLGQVIGELARKAFTLPDDHSAAAGTAKTRTTRWRRSASPCRRAA